MPAVTHNPDAYQRIAFDALHWVGWTFEAAMQDSTRREIIKYIAIRWPKTMDNVIPISRIEKLAHQAAGLHDTAGQANPYPEHSAAGGLFARCFDAEKNRRKVLAAKAHAAIETVATGD
jgi:hypothetical protein